MGRRIEEREDWSALLGDKDALSLRELSERYSVSIGAIQNAFRRNDIQRTPAKAGRKSAAERGRLDALPPEAGSVAAKPTVVRRRGKGQGRPGAPSKFHQLKPYVHLLGEQSDSDVAAASGLNVRTIAKYRTELSIAAYRPRRGKNAAPKPPAAKPSSAPTRASPPKRSPESEMCAWRVTFASGGSVVVVAQDLVGAAVVLARAEGDVAQIESLGRALF